MNKGQFLKGDPLPWLLEPKDPGARYLAMRDVQKLPADDPQLAEARQQAHQSGPIALILEHMQPEGWWSEPGAGYFPKYFSTQWSLNNLAQIGASAQQDERIALACAYYLEHGMSDAGHFTTNGLPSGTVDCLQGNSLIAMLDLGYWDDRLVAAFDWMARSVTGEGIAPMEDKHASPRYYAGKCGPGFACGANNKLPCAWGAAKVMLAFSKLPREKWTPAIERAVQKGVDFFSNVDPATAAYPSGWASKPSGNWWKFGFPVFYITDLLQIVEALVGLGYADDSRLENAWKIIREKQDDQGRWMLEYDYQGKIWADFGAKKQPNKWVTLRVVRLIDG